MTIDAAYTYSMLRQFPAALKIYDRVLDILPNDPDTVASEARIYQAEGNLEQAGKLLAGVNAQTPSFIAFLTKMDQLFLERHFDEAIRLIHGRLTEFRDVSDFERFFNPFFLVLPRNMPVILPGRELMLNKCCVRWNRSARKTLITPILCQHFR